jgi:DUF971 family protein
MPTPIDIKLLQQSHILEVSFDNGKQFALPCEYLRVFSPSAEVRGHGVGEGRLILSKQDVNIVSIDPVGNYAVRLTFDDGHNTGLYSWQTLYELGVNYERNWRRYLERVEHNKNEKQ